MSKRTAGMAFLGVCLALAALLAARTISPLLSGSIFAVALVVFGIVSRGFTRK